MSAEQEEFSDSVGAASWTIQRPMIESGRVHCQFWSHSHSFSLSEFLSLSLRVYSFSVVHLLSRWQTPLLIKTMYNMLIAGNKTIRTSLSLCRPNKKPYFCSVLVNIKHIVPISFLPQHQHWLPSPFCPMGSLRGGVEWGKQGCRWDGLRGGLRWEGGCRWMDSVRQSDKLSHW